MIASRQPISRADLQALATLAMSKTGNPYTFPPFAGEDVIAYPTAITATPAYVAGGAFTPGTSVSLWIFPYKTIAGEKTYSWEPKVKAFYDPGTSGNFKMTWKWTAPAGPTAPEGYVLVIPISVIGGGYAYLWQDVGNITTFSEDGSLQTPPWKLDETLDAENLGHPENNIPCWHGAWLKPLNQIHKDVFTNMDLFGGSSHTFAPSMLASGPWVISVAKKCYLKLNNTSVYNNIKFLYSEADSVIGNGISSEADMLTIDYFGVLGGVANVLNFDVNVLINGTLIIFSPPPGQNPSDWTVTVSDPAIVYTFNPNYLRPGFSDNRTAFIFTFTNFQYTVGTPITITLIPPHGFNVDSGLMNCVFTGDSVVYSATDTVAIHLAGPSAKSVSLPNTLNPITITLPDTTTRVLESHLRAFCPGVFLGNTLPTLGVMKFLDANLPNYNPQPPGGGFPASSRRAPLNPLLAAYEPRVNDREALWPVFRDTDFTPDSLVGKSFLGSRAWRGLAVKNADPISFTVSAAPSEPGDVLTTTSIFVPNEATEVRALLNNPNITVLIKANSAPTISDFDFSVAGGTWFSLPPGFVKDTFWYFSIYNPSSNTVGVLSYFVTVSGELPNGTFFPTNDFGIGETEGYTYRFSDPESIDPRPIPLSGYCVYSLTIERLPRHNLEDIAVADAFGLPALDVNIGVQQNYGYETAGTFKKIQTITIPEDKSSVTVEVFLPVISGTPLVYNSTDTVMIRALVNFQPMMHSQFSTDKVYDSHPWFDVNKAFLFFIFNQPAFPVLLTLDAVVVNDLTALLNLL